MALQVKVDSAKYARRASAAGGDYEAGVLAPRRSQSQAAIAAEGVYEAALQVSLAEKRFSKGLQKSGDGKWSKGVQEKGRARFQQGVANAADEWNTGFSPFAQTLQGLTLAPRGPRGQNYGRTQEVGEALRAKKKSL